MTGAGCLHRALEGHVMKAAVVREPGPETPGNKKSMLTKNGLAIFLGAALFLWGCSESHKPSIFDPAVGHGENWIVDHGQAALSEGSSCPDCHGADLGGGASQVSCFTPGEGSATCHETGTGGRHTAGWRLDSEHGQAAKDRPGISSGLGSCQACHGSDYGGGTSDVSCSSCHRVQAPHPRSPWLRSPNSHSTANEQNAPFCSECHLNRESGEPPGCFNGSLCHGEAGYHPPGWERADNHGAEAMGSSAGGGFASCRECHGEDFSGGSSDVSCSSCHSLEAPHPAGWRSGAGHRAVDEGHAPVCQGCHGEIGPSGGCFSGNSCHGNGDAGESGSPGTEDAEEERPGEDS